MVLRDAARNLVPRRGDPHGPLPPLLITLTFVTGLVDAVSFLKLGHVFVANMTGNVVFLGFAFAGAAEVSPVNSLVALVAFLLGAAGGGRLAERFGEHRGKMLAAATVIEAALVAGALVMALVGVLQYALIALLALAMGMQNATAARRLGVPDLTTSVLTLTLTGLAADSRLVGGDAPRPGRRILAVSAMFAGALVGGLLVLRVNIMVSMALAGGLLLLTALIVLLLSQRDASWVRPPS